MDFLQIPMIPLSVSANRLTPYSITIDGDDSYSVILNKDTSENDLLVTYAYNEEKKGNFIDVEYSKKTIASIPFTLTFH